MRRTSGLTRPATLLPPHADRTGNIRQTDRPGDRDTVRLLLSGVPQAQVTAPAAVLDGVGGDLVGGRTPTA
ncbi:hypothetical protein [Streptomyces sp. AM6-12]|uniref:hypothetical protein n=1 Tax=Streptomyces sp. AM6-12 TaxID=3345149 RepID=UPI0037B38AB0